MTTITDYLNDLKQEIITLGEDTEKTHEEKLEAIDEYFAEAEDAIKELLGRII